MRTLWPDQNLSSHLVLCSEAVYWKQTNFFMIFLLQLCCKNKQKRSRSRLKECNYIKIIQTFHFEWMVVFSDSNTLQIKEKSNEIPACSWWWNYKTTGVSFIGSGVQEVMCNLQCWICIFTASLSVSQVTARLHSMEPVITATLLHTTARSSPTTLSNMRTL